ncbi:MAG: hypothetical protein AAGF12_43505, partial [Myxococcota bacterium]
LVATGGGYALVYYDRVTGNIWGAEQEGGAWNAPVLIDGYGVNDEAIGDSGIGASLFVDDAGVWHVTYVDGAEETLRYATVTDGTVVTELVDNGSTDGANPHPDGRHIIGDDSSVVVTGSGEVRVAYQDSTLQRVMLATKPMGGEWSTRVVDMEASTGYWIEQELVGDMSFIATWWRDTSGGNGVRIFNP